MSRIPHFDQYFTDESFMYIISPFFFLDSNFY